MTEPNFEWSEQRLANIRALIRGLYRVVSELEKEFEGRKFTPDGHLVGSIGEVVAAYAFGLRCSPHPMRFTMLRQRMARLSKSNSREERRALVSTANQFICSCFSLVATHSGRFTMALEYQFGKIVGLFRRTVSAQSVSLCFGSSTTSRVVN
jgi:hypothetical protein